MKAILKETEIIFKNFLLNLVLLFFRAKKSNAPITIGASQKLLIIRLNRVGDALITTPLIKLVKQNTGASVYVLADAKNRFAFSNNPFIDEVIIYRKGFSGFRKLVKDINSKKLDLVIDSHDDVSFTVTMLVGMIKAPAKAALKKKNSAIFTHIIEKPDPRNTHVLLRVASIAGALGIKYNPDELKVVVTVPETSNEEMKSILRKRYPEKKLLLGINISAGSDARFWGVDNFKRLGKWIKENFDVNLLFTCSPRDLKLALQISSDADTVFDVPKFDEYTALIKNLDLLFSPDTATVHVASAFSVPVFGLYVHYNTTDMIWSPYRSDFDGVITTEPNFQNVTFVEVINKFKPFLEKYVK